MKKQLLYPVFVLIFIFFLSCCPITVHFAEAATASLGEAVMEVYSKRVLYSRAPNEKLPMASTTKIMTAILIIQDCNLCDEITVPKECCGVEGSSVYLKAGDRYTVEDLLYGLMLRSGNDCAETLAVYHSGSIEKFAERMNERAKSWGAENTHFVNPHGLPAEGHYTTAYDLALISSCAMQNETFEKIVSTKFYKKYGWKNKNKLLSTFEGANGIKTGYTVQAGRCLVSGAMQNGMQLVCVVLNSPQMFERSEELLQQAFLDYSLQKVYTRKEYSILTDFPKKSCMISAEKDVYYPIRKDERITVKEILPESVALPVQKGDVFGKIEFYLENQLIFEKNLCTINTVEIHYSDYLQKIAEKFR